MYVRLAGRVRVNTASLNAQGTVGNVIELARAHILVEVDGKYELIEVPVISGNTVKHWHFVHFVKAYKELGGGNLCKYCSRLIGYRSPDKGGKSEEYFVKKCAGEDLHGFLQPENNVRRESLVKVSFLIPVEKIESRFDTMTHNRLVLKKEGVVDDQAMMLFKRQYSSSLYGFLLLLDLWYVGRLLYDGENKLVLEEDEVKRRSEAALIALIPLLAGEIGASRSRAQPVWKVEEFIATWSSRPIPPLIHGHYKDYVEGSARTLAVFSGLTGVDAEFLVYGVNSEVLKKVREILEGSRVKLVEKDSWQELIKYLIEKYESSTGAH